MKEKLLDPITPGEILKEDFMDTLGISINKLARDIAVPPNRISAIVNGKRAIYDFRMAKRKIGADIERRIIPFQQSGIVCEAAV